jgi:hypothetical protein
LVNATCRGEGAVVKGELLILGLTCLPAAFWLHRGDGVKGQNRGLNHAANTFPWICHCFPLGWNGYRGNNSYVLTWNQYSSSLFGNIVLINGRTLKPFIHSNVFFPWITVMTNYHSGLSIFYGMGVGTQFCRVSLRGGAIAHNYSNFNILWSWSDSNLLCMKLSFVRHRG